MNHLVLSGTATHVPSRTRFSCYRGPESDETSCYSTACPIRNFSNLESFGFFLTDLAFSEVGNHQRPVARNDMIGALSRRTAGEQTALALHLAGFLARQLLCQGGVV